MSPVAWIAAASIVLSLLTFIGTQFGSKRTATASYVTQLEGRVKTLEQELIRCEDRGKVLFDENVALMRKLSER